MTPLAHMGEALALNAQLHPDRTGARDLSRSLTFRQWEERACRLANGLLGLGLRKGDRVAILAYNCLEWLEIYAATAKAGLVMVPVNFRLLGGEVAYILENSEASALIVQDALLGRVETIGDDLPVPRSGLIHFGGPTPIGLTSYDALIADASPALPGIAVAQDDLWALLYTSGTTGRPKGAMRSHGGMALHNLAILANLELGRADSCLLVMPMCHANSLFFASAFSYTAASCCVYDAASFDPEHLLRSLAEQRASFTSLVPTHYIMMLALPEAVRARYDVSAVTRLLISSAPARRDTKLAIMECFRNSRLHEMYGSTEAGWVTLLRPDEQFSRLG